MARITSASLADTRGDYKHGEMAMSGQKGKKKWLTVVAALAAAVALPLAEAGVIGPEAAAVVHGVVRALVGPAQM